MSENILEDEIVWRYCIRDPSAFTKFRVKELGKGVKITFGKLKNSSRWDIQNYMFDKTQFKTKEQVRSWVESHLKSSIDPNSALNYNTFDEYRRQALRAFIGISKVK